MEHGSEITTHNADRRMEGVNHVEHCLLLLLTHFLFCLLLLSVTMAIVTRWPLRVLRSSSALCSFSLRKFWTSLGPFTGAGPSSVPPWGLEVFMKLLNEAETGHLCSDADDHACSWHGQTNGHFGANYADFTLAKIWIKLVLNDGWVLRDGTPSRVTFGLEGLEMTDS